PHTTITLANTVDAGTFVPLPAPRGTGAATPAGAPSRGRGGAPSPFAALPAFFRVGATLMPSADSPIKNGVCLPTPHWNGKFVIPGNGGFAGAINPTPLAAALRSGYAAATTDTGHEGGSGRFMLDRPERLTDFADRAIHETALQGKAIVAAFYSSAPKY